MADAGLPYFDEDDLVRVRTRIYESMGDLDELAGALMAAARRLGAAHVVIHCPSLDAKQGYHFDAFATHMDMSVMQAFARESGILGPYLDGALRKHKPRPGLVLTGDQMCHRVDALQSPWQSVFIPNDCGDPLAATFSPVNGHDAPVSCITFWRSRRAPRFEPDAADRLRLFVRDLDRMTRIALTLRAREREKALLAAALDGAADSVFLVRADRGIVHANGAASALLNEGDAFIARDKKLEAANASGADRLARAVTRAAERAEGCNLSIPRSGRRPIVVAIAPIPGETADRLGPGAAAVLVATDPDRHNPQRHRIVQTFFLTESEAHLARALYAGAPIADAAFQSGLAESAARDELRSIFRKLNVETEADMIRVLSAIQHT